MLQEGLKNLNQGSLATWAKMAESWFAVCFEALLECAEGKTIISFVGLTCELLKAYIHDLVFVFRRPMVAMTATRSVVNSFKLKGLFTGKARLGLGRILPAISSSWHPIGMRGHHDFGFQSVFSFHQP
jgi:hypothetical protein